jgi:hypothetical protein
VVALAALGVGALGLWAVPRTWILGSNSGTCSVCESVQEGGEALIKHRIQDASSPFEEERMDFRSACSRPPSTPSFLKADYRCRSLASPAGHESDSEYPRARAQVIVSKHGMRREAPLRKWAMLHESSPWVPKKAMSPVKQVLSANDGTPDTMRSSDRPLTLDIGDLGDTNIQYPKRSR